MEQQNLIEFLLLGHSEDLELQPLLFELFLTMYLVTVLKNLLIILAVSSDPRLHNPMYFFLSNLALADIGFISTTVPTMLVNIQTQSKSITLWGCLTQCPFFFSFCPFGHSPPDGVGLLLPFGLPATLLDGVTTHILHGSEMPYFFCDPSQVLNLLCSDTSTENILVYFTGAVFGGIPVLGTLFFYTRIIFLILGVPSSGGKYKGFSTCGSHLSVVCLFFGTDLGAYLSSAISSSPRNCAVASVMYTVVVPMLNPFMYSLRNRDINRALWSLSRKA
ncbi:olfactory receptor 18-like [Elephas maximus indicus]|uniref:olfactory receptor 18-like n=1 Tax=Elephas maximus indicus TaxID=99487 RepID=UPI0021171877|nr:olfactory receptor 18-like [Elephas maximus indicus]